MNRKKDVNGVCSNGHSSSDKHRSSGHQKSSSKDKHRDKDRDKDREHKSGHRSRSHKYSRRSRHQDKDKERDKDRISSSHKSSNCDKDGFNDKKRDNDKDKERSKDHQSSNRDKDKEKSLSNRDKDKDSCSDREKDKHMHMHKRSSSSKHKSSNSSSKQFDKDRHHSGDRHRDKDRDRDHKGKSVKEEHKYEIKEEIKEGQFFEPLINDFDMKIGQNNVSQASACDYSLSLYCPDESHSSMQDEAKEYDEQHNSVAYEVQLPEDKDKERSKDHQSSNRRDKEKSLSSRDKDKDSRSDREKDKDRHKRSSSSKHKSSSSSSKHRDKDRPHSSKSGDRHRDKDRDGDRKEKGVKEEHKNKIKAEIKEKQFTEPHINDFDMKIEDNNVCQASSCDYSLSQFRPDESNFSIKAEAVEYDEEHKSIANEDLLPEDQDKERSKDHKSSNCDRVKEKSLSNRDKDKDSRSDREKTNDRHKRSSSSNHKSSSNSSKPRDKDRNHSSKSGERDRHRDKDRDSDHKGESVKEEHKSEMKAEIKEKQFTEAHINDFDMKIEQNNVCQASSCDYSLSQFRPDKSHFSIEAEAKEYDEQHNSVAYGVPLAEEDKDDIPMAERKLKKMKKVNEEDDARNIEKIKEAKKMKRQETTDGPPNKKANISSEHSKIVASHYNNLQEKDLHERSKSNIFYMRNFNNWIKSMLINEYLTKIKQNAPYGAPLKVLDMCCGKGGDLLKWEKGCITHLICTDIADISVEQCQSRYATMAKRAHKGRNKFRKIFSAEFFASDCTRTSIREQFEDVSIKLNLVSCQFSFHYCFESLKQAQCMLRNAAECLTEGGYFIGTIPDANEIIRRQRREGTNSFGNDIYKISFLCDSECPPLFGAKYHFQLEGVVDCPEFLVHFPMLVKLARKFGLEFVMKERFEDFYKRNLGNGKALMERMNALETYPSHHHSKDDLNNDNYSHVAGTFDRSSNSKCGTLSKSEWEATSLYMVFAFRKMKTE